MNKHKITIHLSYGLNGPSTVIFANGVALNTLDAELNKKEHIDNRFSALKYPGYFFKSCKNLKEAEKALKKAPYLGEVDYDVILHDCFGFPHYKESRRGKTNYCDCRK